MIFIPNYLWNYTKFNFGIPVAIWYEYHTSVFAVLFCKFHNELILFSVLCVLFNFSLDSLLHPLHYWTLLLCIGELSMFAYLQVHLVYIPGESSFQNHHIHYHSCPSITYFRRSLIHAYNCKGIILTLS